MKLPKVFAITGAVIGAITAWTVGNVWHELGGGAIAIFGAVIIGVSTIACWCVGTWVDRRYSGFSLKAVMEPESFEAAGLRKLTRRELRTLSRWLVGLVESISTRGDDSESIVEAADETPDGGLASTVGGAGGAVAVGGLASTVGGAGLAIGGGAVAIPPVLITAVGVVAGWSIGKFIGSLFSDDDADEDVIYDVRDLMEPDLFEATGLRKLSPQERSTFSRWLTHVIDRTIEEKN